jgi:serine/threonine protein kinase
LRADNLLIAFEDDTVIKYYVQQQTTDPALSVFRNGRHVWQSRPDFGPFRRGTGLLKISDFGAAVSGDVSRVYNHDIQPQQFCAPEVLLNAGWTYSADIWNVRTMVCTLSFLSCTMTELTYLIVVGAAGRYHSLEWAVSSRCTLFKGGSCSPDDKTTGETAV